MPNCIDVSYHQGSIDWKRVRAGGVESVILRASIWTSEDQKFREYIQGAQAAGLDVGAYHYACAESVEEAAQEAGFFLKTIAPYQLTFPVAYDFEDPRRHTPMGKDLATAIVKAFLEKLEASGYYGMLYTSASWMTSKFHLSKLEGYDKWVAHYGVDKPAYAGSYGIWQYGVMGQSSAATLKGSIQGIAADCDVNHVYKDYPAIIKAAGLNGWGGGDPPGADYKALYQSEKAMRAAAEADRDAYKEKYRTLRADVLSLAGKNA